MKKKDKKEEMKKQKEKQALIKMKEKYFEYYDDIKCHTKGYEDW